MTDALMHRGPDKEGFYINRNIGLGFRRLSIIDLSKNKE
jgi:asparagine synthase (glutamine-hydrolysing)